MMSKSFQVCEDSWFRYLSFKSSEGWFNSLIFSNCYLCQNFLNKIYSSTLKDIFKPKWWNTVHVTKKSQWIVFPWENTLNSKTDREDYIKKRGLSWERNFQDLKKCDCIFAIVNGNPPDEGVMIELGIAIALKKRIFLFRDDFRNCSDSNEYPLNLMLFLGLPKDNWEKYYFESLQDIKSNKKRFVEWAEN